jgi:hypothetical protein
VFRHDPKAFEDIPDALDAPVAPREDHGSLPGIDHY